MTGADGDTTFAETIARLNRLELRLDDLDALLAPGDGYGLDGTHEAPSPLASTAYPDLASWVGEYFTQTFVRPLGGEWRWCPRWSEHAEAVARLEALWRSWEKLRTDPDLGMATWLRDHLDPQLTVLLGGRGPFAQCSPNRHEVATYLPVQLAGL